MAGSMPVKRCRYRLSYELGDVGLVDLRGALPVGDHAVVGSLLVVDDGAALGQVVPRAP